MAPGRKKAGIDHVQPPVAVLEEMLALRFHLDPASAETGALMVLPGSHCLGRLDPAEAGQRTQTQEAHLCEAAAGDVLVMRPLLLHASRKAARPRRRRVIHVEFAADLLAPPLEWYEPAASQTLSWSNIRRDRTSAVL
jgi:ectoine hydroxylase-related dioxygenase (phytanoyl-CoA dioxygenase family)